MKMTKWMALAAATALFAAPVFTAEAFSLGGLVENVVKEKVSGNSGGSANNGNSGGQPAIYSGAEASREQAPQQMPDISGRILVNGVPVYDARVAGCKDMVIERGYQNRLDLRQYEGTPGGKIGVEHTDKEGKFCVRAAAGIPYRMIFWIKGYEPIVMDNVMAPIDLGDINLTQPNDDIPAIMWGLEIEDE